MTAPVVVVRSHRRVGFARRALARLGVLGLLALTLVAGQAIIRGEPDTGETLAPFYLAAEPNERIEVGGLAVTVLSFRGGPKLKTPDGPVVDTGGVWIIVRVRLEAINETTLVGFLALGDAEGRSFRVSDRFRQSLGEFRRDLQPGIPVEGDIAFEVPADAATSLTFQLAETSSSLSLRPVSDIRLPVTRQTLTAWQAESTPMTLADAEVVA